MTRIVLATAVLVVLSVLGWWLFIFEPARDQEAALEAETAALLAEEMQLSNQRGQLLALRDQAPVLREELDRLSALIPPDPDQARLLELVQGAADASGVSFTSLAFTDPMPVEGAPPVGELEIVLGATTVTGSMQATYFQLVDFLRRLEVGSSRAILVRAVGLNESESGFPALDATFSADIFSLIPAPAVDPVAAGTVVPVPEIIGTPAPLPTVAGTPVPTPTPTP